MGKHRKSDWQYLLGTHKSLDPSFSYEAGEISNARCYLLTISNIKDLTLQPQMKTTARNVTYPLDYHVTLYSLSNRRFIGRTYHSKKQLV